jgi:hypothetical protein
MSENRSYMHNSQCCDTGNELIIVAIPYTSYNLQNAVIYSVILKEHSDIAIIVVRVPVYRFRDSGLIPGTTRFSEK